MDKKSPITGNITLTPNECDTLKRYATNGIIFNAENERLKGKLESAQKSASILYVSEHSFLSTYK